MRPPSNGLDSLRAPRTELENHYIDELLVGRIGRREFLRRGSTIGMSASLIGAILSACGSSSSNSSASQGGAPKRGGTLRVAASAPVADVNPLTVADPGGGTMLSQTGEFLIFDNGTKLQLQPMLARSWSPNKDGSVWTFKLRQGVKFHNGAVMTADDVVYTMQQLADPNNASNALSSFAGVLSPAGVRKVDVSTVEFRLDSANGNFPYLVSSDNYNAIIVPKGTDFAKWATTFVGTGPFKLQSYTANVGANFVANPSYWGPTPLLSATAFTFYTAQQPQILALQSGEVDVIDSLVPSGAQAVLNNPSYKIIKLVSSYHRELSLRNDQAPFTDPRVRQAMALTLDRAGLVSALLNGYGSVANDYPFGPRFASVTDTSVPQRTQNISKAKQLLAAAGHPDGFTSTLYTDNFEENPQLAQAIKADAAKAGITINLKVETQATYYGKASFGNSDWLDGTMSLVEYADRGAPNVLLEAPLTSHGPFNAARFRNTQYDSLAAQFVSALDLQTQRQIAGKIERLLMQETPIVYPYWINWLTATAANVHGVIATADSQLVLGQASKS